MALPLTSTGTTSHLTLYESPFHAILKLRAINMSGCRDQQVLACSSVVRMSSIRAERLGSPEQLPEMKMPTSPVSL